MSARSGRMLAAALALGAPAASAQLAVFDPQNFGQAVLQAEHGARAVLNQARQIEHQVRMIDNQLKALERLARGDLAGMSGGLAGQLARLRRIARTAESLNRRVGTVRERFGELFPSQGPASEPADPALRARWRGELMAASRLALAARAELADAERAGLDARAALAASAAADGQVRQLQSANALLGVLAVRLNDVALATGAAADLAAVRTAAAAEGEAADRALLERFLAPRDLADGGEARFGPPGGPR